jgi:hypothetical protein
MARTVNVVVNDGSLSSNTAAKQVSVVPVNDPPTMVNETFDVLGNTELRVDMTAGTTPHTSETTNAGTPLEGVLDNDTDVEGNPFVVTAITDCSDPAAPFDCTLPDGAVIHVEANGEFSYTPGPGDTAGSFTYTVTDNPVLGSPASPASANGTVTFDFLERVWYVDADFVGTSTGTSVAPFTNFSSLNGAGGSGDSDSPGDYIFVHAATATITSTLELEANQHLLGEGVGLSIPVNLNGNGPPTDLVPAGTHPAVTSAANTITVTQAVPVEIRGLSLASTGGGGNAIDLTATGAFSRSASLTIANNGFAGAAAETIDVNGGATGTLALTIGPNIWTGTHAGNGIDVQTAVAGAAINLALTNNSPIATTSATSSAILVNQVAGTITITAFSGIAIPGSHAGTGVMITNARFDQTPGGSYQTVSAGAATVGASGVGNGVGANGMLFINVSGDVSFTDLNIFADNGAALLLGGTGPVDVGAGTGTRLAVTANTGDVHAVGGAAVRVSNATIGLQLLTLSASTPTNGVALTNVNGQFSAPAGSTITKSSGLGAAFLVDNSAAGTTVLTSTYAGTITNSSGTGSPVTINTADTGSALTFSGAITDTGGQGISLTGNTGATMSFSGGLTLNGAASKFAATAGGTLNVTGTNTIGGHHSADRSRAQCCQHYHWRQRRHLPADQRDRGRQRHRAGYDRLFRRVHGDRKLDWILRRGREWQPSLDHHGPRHR